MNEQGDSDLGGQQNFALSPPSSIVYNMGGMVTSPSTSSSSPKKSRRGKQKRVVQIPMKETEGSISNTPPSDSWAWRKYGQKPIKGSPYPRGYYRCSSKKGCPARKQVDRSHVDPTMVVVTYSYEHNHALPVFKNHHHHNYNHNHSNNNENSSSVAAKPIIKPERLIAEAVEAEDKFAEELRWLGEMEIIGRTSSTVVEGPIFGGYDDDVASVFMPMREEDELLFADLEELPEFSPVFKRGSLETAEEWPQWCGTTS